MAQDNLNDIDKLLEIAENSKVVFEDTDVEKFIREVEIKKGASFVPNYVIYYTYYRWNPKGRVNKNSFFRQFGKHFQKKIIKNERGYLVDDSAFDMSLEGKFKARSFLRKETNGKKENKKKSG